MDALFTNPASTRGGLIYPGAACGISGTAVGADLVRVGNLVVDNGSAACGAIHMDEGLVNKMSVVEHAVFRARCETRYQNKEYHRI